MAVGDAWVVNDPITGQGANLGSHCAWVLADAILADVVYDELFCRQVEERMWEMAGPVTDWSNAFLQPPADHVLELLGAATADKAVADALIGGFADPQAMWRRLATPDRAAAFLRRVPGSRRWRGRRATAESEAASPRLSGGDGGPDFGAAGGRVSAGRRLDLGGHKQRAVLAAARSRSQPPGALDRFVDLLWDGRPPAQGVGTVRAYVSNLRRPLEPDRGRVAGERAHQ